MDTTNKVHGRRAAARILESDTTPLQKVRQLVALGYDEIDADALVVSLQMTPNNMAYYEQLPNPEYDEDRDDNR